MVVNKRLQNEFNFDALGAIGLSISSCTRFFFIWMESIGQLLWENNRDRTSWWQEISPVGIKDLSLIIC